MNFENEAKSILINRRIVDVKYLNNHEYRSLLFELDDGTFLVMLKLENDTYLCYGANENSCYSALPLTMKA